LPQNREKFTILPQKQRFSAFVVAQKPATGRQNDKMTLLTIFFELLRQ
jgi:hypothetical protein